MRLSHNMRRLATQRAENTAPAAMGSSHTPIGTCFRRPRAANSGRDVRDALLAACRKAGVRFRWTGEGAGPGGARPSLSVC